MDQLRRHLQQLEPPQPVAQVAQEVPACFVPALSAAQEAQHWSTAPQAALLGAETVVAVEAAPPPVQRVQLVA